MALRYLQAIEAGRQNLTLATVARLAAGLKVAVAELFQTPASKRARKQTGR